MPKFRYIITNVFDGKLEGTNDEPTAVAHADGEDSFVYDTEKDIWLCANGEEVSISEARTVEVEDEEDDEDLEEVEDDEE